MFNITLCTCSIGVLAYGFLTVVKTGLLPKSFTKGVKSCLNSYPGSFKQLANPGRIFIYVLIITARNLIEVVRQYFKDFEPACGEVDHRHAC